MFRQARFPAETSYSEIAGIFSIKMFLPEIGVVTGVANTLPSFSFPWAWTRTIQRFDLADANGAAKISNNPIANTRVMRD